MKQKFVVFLFLFYSLTFAQDITNTLGTSGIFTIKDNTNTFFSVSQTNGTVTLISPLAGNQRSSFFKGSDRFLHTYNPAGTTGFNTFLGINSGNFSMTGALSHSSYNTAVGYQTLSSLTIGNFNSAFGTSSLQNNTTGFQNSAFGAWSLISNSTGRRIAAFGFSSLYSNTSGDENSAFGYYTLFNNTEGFYNSAFGSNALRNNTTAYHNSAFGNTSLRNNTSGEYNSAFGSQALFSNSTGNYNTSVGYYAGFNITTGNNNLAVGYDAQVPSASSSNQIRIGNTSITYAGVQVAWTVTSDRRYKDNISPIGLGLGFISKLNPVSYIRKNDENQKTEYGLIAQEVEEVLKSEGIENHAMLTVTDEGMYELRYNDLLAPMIKAIQELKVELQKKDEIITSLTAQNEKILTKLSAMEKMQEMFISLIKNKQESNVELVKSMEE